jgi:3-oxoadipate enol-lactonase
LSRPRILLLHAFPLDCRMWAETKRSLEEAGWPAVAPDLPGPEAEPTLGDWAEHVLRSVDGPLVPVGVSMGGYLAFELWRRARDRIVALALVATRAGPDADEARRARDENIQLVRDVGVAALWERLAPNLFAPDTPADVVARARELALEQGATRLASALAAMRDREDATPLLPRIDVPVLVVAGDEDRIIPVAEAERMASALPDARVVRIPGAGHLPPLERPDDLNAALLAFLAEAAR